MNKNLSFIPKDLFGEQGIIKTINNFDVFPVIIGLSRRINSYRNISTISMNLILEDFGITTTNPAYNKKQLAAAFQQLIEHGYIMTKNIFDYKINDAFEVEILYNQHPFIMLYDEEVDKIKQIKTGDTKTALMVYLYVVQHINEQKKQPTWVTVDKIAYDLNLNIKTAYKYLKILREDAKILKIKGKKRNHEGKLISMHTRNMPEYLHRHRAI